MSFPKQMIASTLVVVGGIGGLFFLGQKRHAEKESKIEETSEKEEKSPLLAVPDGLKRPLVQPIEHGTRALVPPGAWLVADFRGDLTGNMPFVEPGDEGLCAKVPAPERVSLAILQPIDESGPILQLAAPNIPEQFWGCARDRIVRAGGVPVAQNDQFDVLRSPSGIVARGPNQAIVFLSNEGHLEEGLGVLSGLAQSAASAGDHARLYRRMHPEGKPRGETALDLTLSLPENWLDSVGDQAKKTPLRHVQAAFVSVKADGSAQGGIDCVETGCGEVRAFLERAKTDMTVALPLAMQKAIARAFTAHHLKGTGRIAINWSTSGGRLQDLFAPLFGGGRALISPPNQNPPIDRSAPR